MKNGKIFLILIGIIVLVVIAFAVIDFGKKDVGDSNSEITPGEEITEEQERQTIISLYYMNSETNTLMPEARIIDVKNLIENPYKSLTEYLIESPKTENLRSVIPTNTKVNGATNTLGVVTLDLSKDFIENQNAENISQGISAIVNTLTELNDVNSVKFLIDGEENKKIEGTDISFDKDFVREII
ncbi:MAG: GerMN domain-containing protein [Clostridia bacterium]|nr:GerMN domain-containing protein [Clostridia bacterium]MCI9275751.1 GerMN domain-containing protein [Clostridia bacterium]